jgi:N-terminal domain of anti-restriction factor ArdC
LLLLQRPESTHVAGFHAWLKLGRHVLKGEKGITIVVPHVRRKKGDRPDAGVIRPGRRAITAFTDTT